MLQPTPPEKSHPSFPANPSKNWGPVKPYLLFWKLGRRFDPPVPPSSRKNGGRGWGEVHTMQENWSLDFSMWSLQSFTWVPHEGVSPQHRYHLVIWYHTNKVFFSWGCFSPKQRKTEQKKERENSSWLALKLKFAVVLRYYE